MGGVADVINDAVEIGSFGIIDDVTGAEAGRAASRGAANAQLQANRENINFLQQLYNAQAGNNEFAQGIGNQALAQLGGLYGLTAGQNPASSNRFENGRLVTTPGTPGAASTGTATPDYSAFFSSPDYQFALQQGQQGLDRVAAAGGNLFSGGRARAASEYNQGMASQQLGNYTNRLASLAGVGQTATQSTNNALANVGSGISGSLLNQGDARASGYLGGYQAGQQGVNNLLGLGSLFVGGF